MKLPEGGNVVNDELTCEAGACEPTPVAILRRAWGILRDERNWGTNVGYAERRSSGVCMVCAVGACAQAAAEASDGLICEDRGYDAVDIIYAHIDDKPVRDAQAKLQSSLTEMGFPYNIYTFNDSEADHEGVLQLFESTLRAQGLERPRPLTREELLAEVTA